MGLEKYTEQNRSLISTSDVLHSCSALKLLIYNNTTIMHLRDTYFICKNEKKFIVTTQNFFCVCVFENGTIHILSSRSLGRRSLFG